MEILQIQGTDERLYPLVGPLVMNPVVLKQNYNFPFRTAENFIWLVAIDEEGKVLGFLPVENKKTECVINNYFVWKEHRDVLRPLLRKAVGAWNIRKPLAAVAFLEDEELFRSFGFKEDKRWARYVKMKKEIENEDGKEKARRNQ